MDKKHTNTASQLADRGWADMQRILDQEMPVKRKRRPVIWFWWAAALVGLGVTAWWSTWENNAPAVPVPPALHKPAVGQPVAGAGNRQNSEQTDFQNTTEKKPLQDMNAGARQMAASNLGTTNSIAAVPVDQPVSFGGQSVSPADVSNTHKDNLAPTSVTSPPNTLFLQDANDVPDGVQPAHCAVLNLLPTNPLPPLSTGYPEYLESRHPAHTPGIVRKRGVLQAGAYAGLQVNPQSGTLLPSAGLMADWRWSRKFGLRTGIGYQFEHFADNAQPGTLVSEKAYLDATGDQRVLENNPGPQSGPVSSSTEMRKVLLPVSTIHRLELPLQVYWQARPRWRAYAGVHMQYAFRAQSTGSVVELDSSRVLSGVNPAFTSRLASEQTRTWTSFASFGAGYQLSRHLEIALHCRLSTSLKSANQMDFDNMDTSNSGQFNSTADRINTSITTPSHFQLQMTWKF